MRKTIGILLLISVFLSFIFSLIGTAAASFRSNFVGLNFLLVIVTIVGISQTIFAIWAGILLVKNTDKTKKPNENTINS